MDRVEEYAKDLKAYEARLPSIQSDYEDIKREHDELTSKIRTASYIPSRYRRNRRYIMRIRRQVRALQYQQRAIRHKLNQKSNELREHTHKIQSLKTAIGNTMVTLINTTNILEALKGSPPKETVSKPSGLIRALCVGINYVGTEYALSGCVNDAENIKKHLTDTYDSCKDVVILTDEGTDDTERKPTRANILAKLDWLVSGLKPGENVFFSYSGHGGQIRDTNGDEVTGLDGCLFPMNGEQPEIITDDEVRAHLVNKIPEGCKCFIVVDACHSGTMVDMRYRWDGDAFGNVRYTEDKKYAKTRGKVIFLSGCKDDQYSMDTIDHTDNPAGALTWALLETWKRYGSKIKTKYLLWDVRNYLASRGYSQIPQLSTGRYEDLQDVFDLSS